MPPRPKLLLTLLILASGFLYLIGNNSTPLWDRDEPRYAQTSRQMLQTGDWIVPHYLNLIRTAKPVLIYWCQATAMALFGQNNFAARFPSALATTLLLILLATILYKPLGPEQTLWTLFIFATSALTIATAKMCLTDAVQLLWITIAQLCMYALYRRRTTWPIIITLAISIALAGLTKGPVILGFLTTTLLTLYALHLLDRRFPPSPQSPPHPLTPSPSPSPSPPHQQLIPKIIVSLLIISTITLPWILAVNHRASTFLKSAVTHDIWDRMMTPLEQHTGPPGYYLLTIWATFFPWSIFIPLAIALAFRYRASPRTRFALAAVIGPWIMLECIRTKLPHYFLPAFPPLAYLTADALIRCLHHQHNDLNQKPFRITIALWAILVSVLGLTPWLALRFHQPLPIPAMIAISILSITYAITVYLNFKAHRSAVGLLSMGAGTMILVALLYTFYFPRADFLRLSPRIAADLISQNATHPNDVLMLDYMEPSLAFAQGGTIREAGEVALNHRSIPNFTPWLVVTQDIWNNAPKDIRQMFEITNQESGWAYANKGRWINVLILKRKDPPPVKY